MSLGDKMGRGRKAKQKTAVKSEKLAEKPKETLIRFSRGLLEFRNNNSEKAPLLKDSEAVKAFVKKHIPSLEASREEWNQLLNKF